MKCEVDMFDLTGGSAKVDLMYGPSKTRRRKGGKSRGIARNACPREQLRKTYARQT